VAVAASVVVSALFAVGRSAAQEKTEGVALTIYSTARPGAVPVELYQPALRKARGYGYRQGLEIPGYAVVKQQRKVQLEAGRGVLRFIDVAAMIEPTTVMFASLTDPEGTSVLEQNFEFDLVSPEKLLEKFIDRPVTLTFVRPDGETELLRGTLLSHAAGQMILRTDDPGEPIQIIRQGADRVSLSELPGGLITRPTLVWTLNAAKGGEHLVRVTYQTSGTTWWADYNLVYEDTDDANRGKIDLGAWVSILNQSGAAYKDAKLKLIAGDVQRAETPRVPGRVDREMMAKAAAPAEGFEEKAFFEYHLYTLRQPTTLPDNSTKQLELFPAWRSVPCEKVYVYYGAPVRWGYGGSANTGRDLGIPMNKKVDVYLRFKNDKESGLGMPLPSGRIRVNKLDPADQTLEFIGENIIDHTPKDEKVLIKLGSAFDIVGERRQTDFQPDTRRKRIDESFEIRVRNHKDVAVTVIVKETLYRWSGWEIREASHKYEKKDARTIHFPVEVEPDGEVVVTYSVRYEW